MCNSVFISLENTIYPGNVLDIGKDNYGVVYNLFKYFNKDGEIEYFEGKGKKNIEFKQYDNCILFFSLNTIINKIEKQKVLSEINNYLKEDGLLYIWDIDKKPLKPYENIIRVCMPDKTLKEFNIKDNNPLKDSSIELTRSLLEKNFSIIDYKSGNDIYYFICKKRRKI